MDKSSLKTHNIEITRSKTWPTWNLVPEWEAEMRRWRHHRKSNHVIVDTVQHVTVQKIRRQLDEDLAKVWGWCDHVALRTNPLARLKKKKSYLIRTFRFIVYRDSFQVCNLQIIITVGWHFSLFIFPLCSNSCKKDYQCRFWLNDTYQGFQPTVFTMYMPALYWRHRLAVRSLSWNRHLWIY